MSRLRTRLTLLALLALVAIPFAASGLCCATPKAACCGQHCPASGPGLCSTGPVAAAEAAPSPVPDLGEAAPLRVLLPAEPSAPPSAAPPIRRQRPRTPLLEGGACLHTTVLPPPAHA